MTSCATPKGEEKAEYDMAMECTFQCLFNGTLSAKMFRNIACRCKDGKVYWRDGK